MVTVEQMRKLGHARRKYQFNETLDNLITRTYTEARRTSDITRGLDSLERLRDWPRWVWQLRAAELGLTNGRIRQWTAEEDRTLLMMAGQASTARIARRLGRTYSAVKARAHKLQVSTVLREGYTVKAIALCFGVSQDRARAWVRKGLFGRHEELIRESQVMRFIREHHDEFDLRRVDQVWFLSMVFGGTLVA